MTSSTTYIQAIRLNLQNTNVQQKIEVSQNLNETQRKMIIINDVFPFPLESHQRIGIKRAYYTAIHISIHCNRDRNE